MEVCSDENRLSIGGRRKTSRRRSSILKGGKSPTRGALEDRDLNVQQESDTTHTGVTTRSKKSRQSSSRRVSFASKDEVKEFRVEEWDPIWNRDNEKVETCIATQESQEQSGYRQPASTIKGLDSLLTGNIQLPDDQRHNEIACASFSDGRQSIEMGLDLTSCNGPGFLSESIDTGHYTENIESVDTTLCYGQGILNKDMPQVTRKSTQADLTCIFGDNTASLDITRCHGWGVQDRDEHQKQTNDPDVVAEGCGLDLTCHGSGRISLEENETRPMARNTNAFVPANQDLTGQRKPLCDVKPFERHAPQSPFPEEGKLDGKAFLARLQSSNASSKQTSAERLGDQHSLFIDTNLRQKESKSGFKEKGSFNVKDFLFRLSSKPPLDEQQQKNEPFVYEDDEVEFTVCRGSGIRGATTAYEEKKDRRSIYKTEDIDFTLCHGQGVFQELETATLVSSSNTVVAKKQEKVLTKVDESDDDEATATMDLTGCVDSLHQVQHLTEFVPPDYGTDEEAVNTTTCGNFSFINCKDPLHLHLEVEPMEMTMTSCVNKLLPENFEYCDMSKGMPGSVEFPAMDITCIDKLESHDILKRKSSKLEALEMDMTTCIGNYEETVGSRGQPPETFAMDMTNCMGNLEQAIVQKGKPSSRESLAMDMTACFGYLDQAKVHEGKLSSKESTAMDMTTCVEELRQSNASRGKPTKRESLAMDMTACIGNLEESSASKGQPPSTETFAMDMTTCVGNLGQVSVQRGKASSRESLAMDMTTCFENLDQARASKGKPSINESLIMDITTCSGNLEQSSLQKREPSSRVSLGMDMTCVGSLEQSVVPGGMPSNRKSLVMDMTLVGDVAIKYGDNGKMDADLAREAQQMDMTACVVQPSDMSAYPQPLPVGDIPTSSVAMPVAAVVKKELQSKELTAQNSSQSFCCPSMSVTLGDGGRNQTVSHTSEIQEHSPVPRADPKVLMYTNLFGPIDDTTLEHMETDINNSMSVLKSKLSESIASGKLQLPEFPALSQPSTQPELNTSLPVSKLCSQFGRKRTSDDVVLKTSPSSPEETSLLSVNKSWDVLLSNGTIATVADGSNQAKYDSTGNDDPHSQPSLPKIAKMGEAQQSEEVQVQVQITYQVPKESTQDAPDQMSPDNEPCENDPIDIMEQSPLKVDFREELSIFQADSCSDDLKILDDLDCLQTSLAPLTTEKVNKAKLGKTERLGSNLSVITEESDGVADSTCHITASPGEKALSEITEENLSVSPSMTVGEFLSSTGISFGLQHRVRRSMIPPIQNVQPRETRDFILQLCYIKPKADLYGETIADIETEIAKLKTKVEAQEQQLSSNNPKVFQLVRDSSPAELSELKQQLEKMQHTCKKHAMMKYTARKIKLKRQLKSVMKESMEQLQMDIDAVDEYTSMADSCIYILDDTDKEVTKNISSLRKTAASNNKKLERVSKHQQVSQQHLEEMKAKQEELTALEEKRSTLIGEKQELVTQKASLEREEIETNEKIRCLKKENNLKPEVKELIRKYKSLISLHEWTVEEWDWGKGTTFTFLEDTLHLVLLFGKQLDDRRDAGDTGESAMKVVQVLDVRLDSRLTEDSELSDKLAHTMVRQATEKMDLQQMCPTTAGLPQLLEQLSNIVYTARLVRDEAWRISLSHLSSVTNTTFHVDFSSLKAFTKFIVEFQLDVSLYPKALEFKVTPKIGRVTGDDVEQLFDGVAPGKSYLTRLVGQADTLLEQLKSSALG